MQTQQMQRSQRQIAQEKYKAARSNLIVMIALTLLNILLLFTGANMMMLFSATVPYYVVIIGQVSGNSTVLTVCLVFAIACLLGYFLCWVFSKKHYGWMVAALVFFIMDALALVGFMLLAQVFSGILDVVFHVLVLYYLIIGVKYGHQLTTLPEEVMEAAPAQVSNTAPLRMADPDVKHRVLLETEAAGYRICYRRVKRVNELVINGHVYAELEMLVEPAHELSAQFNGHLIQAGFDGTSSYICVDGNQVVKKMRLY